MTNPTLQEIQAQIQELQAKMADIRKSEIGEAVAKIRALVDQYGLTVSDVFPNGKLIQGAKKAVQRVAPKYRDPVSGKTWTGRGITPTWIGDKNKEEFLIQA